MLRTITRRPVVTLSTLLLCSLPLVGCEGGKSSTSGGTTGGTNGGDVNVGSPTPLNVDARDCRPGQQEVITIKGLRPGGGFELKLKKAHTTLVLFSKSGDVNDKGIGVATFSCSKLADHKYYQADAQNNKYYQVDALDQNTGATGTGYFDILIRDEDLKRKR